MELIEFDDISDKIITIRDEMVILDSDVAELYGVETKRVNEAVKNNPDKFPDDFIMKISENEYNSLRSKFSTLENPSRGQHIKYLPKAFTESGLYMLATILKSPQATQTSIKIIRTFTKTRELSRGIAELPECVDKEQQALVATKTGVLLTDLLGGGLKPKFSKTSFKINLAFFGIEHTVEREID